jgi:hypothetical protein
MKAILMASVPCVLALGLAFAAQEEGLPSWKDSKPNVADSVAGGVLLVEEPATDEEADANTAIPVLEQPAEGEISTTGSGLVGVPEKFWPAYFAERPKSFLIDPQNLLSPVDKRERLEFLNYHASDSSIDLFVYVFGGDQEIPGEVRQEELAERLYSEGRPAVIIFYFMGAPDRSVLHLSPSLTGTVPFAEQRRALESPVMQALVKADSSGQFEAFLVQMSIRIYWIERMLGVGDELAEAIAVPAKTAPTHEKKSKLMELVRPHLEKSRRFAIPAGATAGGLLLVLALRFWLKRRARYRFPDFEVEPRLGGAHAAGVGGVISFASATVPPASQRDQLPGYLRRA